MAPISSVEKSSGPPDKLKGRCILIVEDDLDLLDFVAQYLEEAGYAVLTASDGMVGLRLAREQMPTLVILDVNLPKLNGFTISRLLKFDENYKHIPIIIWTWRDGENDRDLGLYAGADVFIPKPFEISHLFQSIVTLIGPPSSKNSNRE
jgi:DNA-binding response OmpR family regulator